MCAKTYISTSIVHYKKAETGVSNKLNAYYFGNRSVFRGALGYAGHALGHASFLKLVVEGSVCILKSSVAME